MRPTLRQLEYIVAVAENGRFAEAAKALNVSQPSLSAQIAEAEQELGVPLFERGRTGAIATPLGEEVVRRARYILRQVEEMKALAAHGGEGLSGRIKLGVLPTVGPYLLPRSTARLHERFPDLRLNIRDEPTAELGRRLEAGEVDVALSTPEDHPGADGMPLFKETLWIAAPPEDDLSRRDGPVQLSELAGRTFLTLGLGHRLTVVVQEIAHRAGAYISGDYQGTSLDAIRHMAAMGGGLAVLPELYVKCEARNDETLTLRQIADPLVSREIHLLWRAGSPMADAFRGLGEVLAAAAAQVIEAD